MSKRNTKDHPLPKGGALIQAREILGPSAHVQFLDNPVSNPYRISARLGGDYFASDSWENVLALAKGSSEAKAWSEQQITQSNELAAAVNSLRAKTKEFLKDSKFMGLLNRSEVKFVLGGLKANQ